MSYKGLLCIILVSAVEFMQVRLIFLIMKHFLEKISTADYFSFSTGFKKFVSVFNLTLVGTPSMKMG